MLPTCLIFLTIVERTTWLGLDSVITSCRSKTTLRIMVSHGPLEIIV